MVSGSDESGFITAVMIRALSLAFPILFSLSLDLRREKQRWRSMWGHMFTNMKQETHPFHPPSWTRDHPKGVTTQESSVKVVPIYYRYRLLKILKEFSRADVD